MSTPCATCGGRRPGTGLARWARRSTGPSSPNSPAVLPNSVTVSPPARPNSAAFGWPQAVPADLMLTADGRLRPVSRRYADHLEFLRSANDHLGALADTNVLVVVTTR